MFVTDPVGGFPLRLPGGAGLDHAGSGAAPTRAGRLHNLFAIPVFAGIPVAAMASAATAVRGRDYRWAGYSTASGLAMVGSFVMFGTAFGDGSRLAGKGGVFQRLSIVCGCGWLTALSLRALSYPVHQPGEAYRLSLGSDRLEGQKTPGERRLPGEVDEVDDGHAAIDIAVCKAEFCHPWVVDLVHPCSAHLRQLAG